MDMQGELLGVKSFIQIKEQFPEEVLFFTTDELGIMAFNRVGNNFHFVGLSGDLERVVDGSREDSLGYLLHDVNHADFSVGLPKEVFERVNNILNKSDREKVELALFIYRHENGGVDIKLLPKSALQQIKKLDLFLELV